VLLNEYDDDDDDLAGVQRPTSATAASAAASINQKSINQTIDRSISKSINFYQLQAPLIM